MVISVALIFLLLISLGGWWSARVEAVSWKKAFIDLYNEIDTRLGKP